MQAHVILHDEHTCIHADMHNMLYDILWDPHVVYNTILDDTYIYGKYIYIYMTILDDTYIYGKLNIYIYKCITILDDTYMYGICI